MYFSGEKKIGESSEQASSSDILTQADFQISLLLPSCALQYDLLYDKALPKKKVYSQDHCFDNSSWYAANY